MAALCRRLAFHAGRTLARPIATVHAPPFAFFAAAAAASRSPLATIGAGEGLTPVHFSADGTRQHFLGVTMGELSGSSAQKWLMLSSKVVECKPLVGGANAAVGAGGGRGGSARSDAEGRDSWPGGRWVRDSWRGGQWGRDSWRSDAAGRRDGDGSSAAPRARVRTDS
jgi:hypothetical protein